MAATNKPKKTTRKAPSADAAVYRLKDGAPTHYIAGMILRPGDPRAEAIRLPEGVEPGEWLEEVSPAKAGKAVKEALKADTLADTGVSDPGGAEKLAAARVEAEQERQKGGNKR